MSAAAAKGGAGAFRAILGQHARNVANKEYNVWKQRKDLATKKRLRIQYAGARQSYADIDRMRVSDEDITAEQKVENNLEMLRRTASVKASGAPEGQSTEFAADRAVGEVLMAENKFIKEMEDKETQYGIQEREIKFGMDMAFLDAQASIASTSYRRGDGGAQLFMDLAGAGADAYAMS
tara:strand:- start:9053 stop:9589 length:537 start_codon:yes stop_codon:yes gene_type:complete